MCDKGFNARLGFRWPAAVAAMLWAVSWAAAAPPARTPFELRRPDREVSLSSAMPAHPGFAAVEAPGLPTPPAPFGASGSFMTAYLFPRMATRLGGFESVVGSEPFRTQPESVWRGDVARSIEKQAFRATRAAARDYLVDRWNLEVDLRGNGRAFNFGSSERTGSSKVRLGFAGARPRVTWLTATRTGALKISVDSSGRLGASWRRGEDGRGALAFTADPSRRRIDAGWFGSF